MYSLFSKVQFSRELLKWKVEMPMNFENRLYKPDIAENLGDTLDCQQPRELFLWSSQK